MRESKKDSEDRKVWLSKLAPIIKDLGLARKRVQKIGAARWLLQFANADLESLSAGEITNFGFDILALVIPKDPKAMDNHELFETMTVVPFFTVPDKLNDLRVSFFEIIKPLLDQLAPNTESEEINHLKMQHAQESKRINAEAETMPRVPLSLIKGFHDELKKGFQGFFYGGYWKHSEPASVKWLLCPGVRPNDGWRGESFDNPSSELQPVDRLMLIAGRAVIAEKEKFGVCEKCKRPFIAEKNPLRKFCSEMCSQYVRTTRYRQKQRNVKTKAPGRKAQPPRS